MVWKNRWVTRTKQKCNNGNVRENCKFKLGGRNSRVESVLTSFATGFTAVLSGVCVFAEYHRVLVDSIVPTNKSTPGFLRASCDLTFFLWLIWFINYSFAREGMRNGEQDRIRGEQNRGFMATLFRYDVDLRCMVFFIYFVAAAKGQSLSDAWLTHPDHSNMQKERKYE